MVGRLLSFFRKPIFLGCIAKYSSRKPLGPFPSPIVFGWCFSPWPGRSVIPSSIGGSYLACSDEVNQPYEESCEHSAQISTVDERHPAPPGIHMKPFKWDNKLPINWCRISTINSTDFMISLKRNDQLILAQSGGIHKKEGYTNVFN